MIELKQLYETDLKLTDWMGWIYDIPFIDITPEDCIGRILTGQYQAIVGIDDKPQAIVVYYFKSRIDCYIVGVWGRNNLCKYLKPFYKLLKEAGIKRTQAASTLPQEVFERATTMKRSYISYEKEL